MTRIAANPSAPLTMQPIALRLSAQQMKKLDALRRKTGLARTELLRRALDDYVARKL